MRCVRHSGSTQTRMWTSANQVLHLRRRSDESAFPAGSVLMTPDGGGIMGKVIASITTSVDGYVTGPDDGPVYGLGRGGERLHYWVMGGPWTYEDGHDFAMHGPDKEFYDELVSTLASGVVGRGMYEDR